MVQHEPPLRVGPSAQAPARVTGGWSCSPSGAVGVPRGAAAVRAALCRSQGLLLPCSPRGLGCGSWGQAGHHEGRVGGAEPPTSRCFLGGRRTARAGDRARLPGHGSRASLLGPACWFPVPRRHSVLTRHGPVRSEPAGSSPLLRAHHWTVLPWGPSLQHTSRVANGRLSWAHPDPRASPASQRMSASQRMPGPGSMGMEGPLSPAHSSPPGPRAQWPQPDPPVRP